MGGTIIKNASVNKINAENNKIVSVEYVKDGKTETMTGDIFISSMPLKDLANGMSDVIPKEELDIAKGLPYRDFVTIGILAKKLNLVNKTDIKTLNNIVPDCWILCSRCWC